MTTSAGDEGKRERPSGESGMSSGGTSNKLDRTVAIFGIAATLVGSLVGSLVGAKISADATLGGVETQISASSAKERRDKIAQVYSDYLKAVDAYVSSTEYLRSPGAVTEVPVPTASGGVGLSVPESAFNRFESARSDMQARANDLYAFGSDDSWNASLELIATLPQLSVDGKVSTKALDYNREAYKIAYLKFTRIFCREVASGPKANCGESADPSSLPTNKSTPTPP
jgi:hypothetical protein